MSDYATQQDRKNRGMGLMLVSNAISSIQWKEQDPMTQVTGTFSPEPIADIKEWYKASPLYQ